MVKIDKDKCIGCGACVSVCPDVFRINEASAEVISGKENDNDECVKEAINSCPVNAIFE